ncbi:hypothetical protein GCM10011350_04770 [Marinomonas arctica]|nr:hypothetical protein GCM10011350_04770 [Marinomonas arctica]
MLQGCTVNDNRREKTANNASAKTAPNTKALPNMLPLPEELASCKFKKVIPSTAKKIAPRLRTPIFSRNQSHANKAINDGSELVITPALVAVV